MAREIFYLLIAFLITSCSMKDAVKVKEIKSVNLKGIEYNNLLIEASIEIDNNYIFPVKVESAQLSIISKNDSIGTVEIENPVKIRARHQGTYKFNLRIKSSKGMEFFSVMQNFLKSKPDIRISGTFNAHSFMINRSIPVNENVFGK